MVASGFGSPVRSLSGLSHLKASPGLKDQIPKWFFFFFKSIHFGETERARA